MSIEIRSRSAEKILLDEYLVARAKIIELAATMDRLARAEGDVSNAPQKRLLEEGISILLDGDADKAKRVQLLMSREYQSDWREKLTVDAGRAK